MKPFRFIPAKPRFGRDMRGDFIKTFVNIKTISELPILKDVHIRNALAISLALFVVSAGIVYFSLRDVDYLLVIHFTGGSGINFTGDKNDIFNVLFSGLSISFVNLFLIHIFYNRIRFFSYLISFFNIVFLSLLLIAVGVIISVN